MATNVDIATTLDGNEEAVQWAASELRDFWTLFKPNVMRLVMFTSLCGLYLAPGNLNPILAFIALLAIAGGAAASAAINNWFDRDIDQIMARTRRRPTATGRIAPAEALGVGITLSILSVMVMGLALNWTAGFLLAFTIGFYVFVYTMWLKRRTPQNIVIGGAAGAFPPLVAWAAVTGDVSLMPLVMVAIIFFWTPPHFWALALYRTGDYGRAGVPMLPVVAGRPHTRNQILGYTWILFAVALAPFALGELGPIYGASAAVLGGIFCVYATRLWRDDSDVTAMRMFRFSILYLFLLFGAMVADKAFGGLVTSWLS